MASSKRAFTSLLLPHLTHSSTRPTLSHIPRATSTFLHPSSIASSRAFSAHRSTAASTSSGNFAAAAPPSSLLPRELLRTRIRGTTRWASTSSSVEKKDGEVVVAKKLETSEAKPVEQEEDDDAGRKKPAEKIKLGEVRRLMVLAKPERKTIAVAIGLVRLPLPSLSVARAPIVYILTRSLYSVLTSYSYSSHLQYHSRSHSLLARSLICSAVTHLLGYPSRSQQPLPCSLCSLRSVLLPVRPQHEQDPVHGGLCLLMWCFVGRHGSNDHDADQWTKDRRSPS